MTVCVDCAYNNTLQRTIRAILYFLVNPVTVENALVLGQMFDACSELTGAQRHVKLSATLQSIRQRNVSNQSGAISARLSRFLGLWTGRF